VFQLRVETAKQNKYLIKLFSYTINTNPLYTVFPVEDVLIRKRTVKNRFFTLILLMRANPTDFRSNRQTSVMG
jgi:hypothetical protein